MADIVRIRRIRPDLWIIGPPGAPTVADSDPGVDTAVLEVAGGYLTWKLTSGQRVAAATLHDMGTAQEWLWALYGAEIALAADDYTEPVDLPARPENPDLAAAVRRLAYAHWAARWWPASTVDSIPPLDPSLLDSEIAELTELCESMVDGTDYATGAGAEEDPAELTGSRDAGWDTAVRPRERSVPRADEYALAAGHAPAGTGSALVLDRGSAGWDWRYCPAGVVDASERAVTWELLRAAGSTTIRVHAVTAPGLTADLPGYLRPHALIRTPAGFRDIPLELNGDSWSGETGDRADSVLGIEIYVPGVGPSAPMPKPSRVSGSPHTADSDARPDSQGAVDRRPVADPYAQSESVHSADRAHVDGPVGPPQASSATDPVEQRRMVRELARNRLRMAAARPGEVLPGTAASEPLATGESGGSAAIPLADNAPLRSETTAAEEDSDF
ncbi:hypothetical protein [Nocardia carnea]|uniref:hypothetical protein n=1 Tax=Nocardia carnea TaxID=37328 RepID=UPI002453DE59|nr:hypothetical protein [Nocardia carnea]